MSEGWECPKCGAVMAPWMPSCVNDHKTIVTDSTKTHPRITEFETERIV